MLVCVVMDVIRIMSLFLFSWINIFRTSRKLLSYTYEAVCLFKVISPITSDTCLTTYEIRNWMYLNVFECTQEHSGHERPSNILSTFRSIELWRVGSFCLWISLCAWCPNGLCYGRRCLGLGLGLGLILDVINLNFSPLTLFLSSPNKLQLKWWLILPLPFMLEPMKTKRIF